MFVLGNSMQPTLNPNDCLLVRQIGSTSETESLVGKVVFAERRDRRIVKRITRLENFNYCWLESDNKTLKGAVWYDSNVFGPVPPEIIKGLLKYFLNLHYKYNV